MQRVVWGGHGSRSILVVVTLGSYVTVLTHTRRRGGTAHTHEELVDEEEKKKKEKRLLYRSGVLLPCTEEAVSQQPHFFPYRPTYSQYIIVLS